MSRKVRVPIGALYLYVGSQIKTIRTYRNISQENLALAIGLRRVSITNIELGCQRVQLDQVYAIANVLNVPAKLILPDNNDANLVPISDMFEEFVAQKIKDAEKHE